MATGVPGGVTFSNKSSTAFSLEAVTVNLHGTPVLQDVTLSAALGERISIIGPSGSGKSTLLRTLNGMTSPSAGRVSVLGTPLGKASLPVVRRRMATIFQSLNLWRMMSALDNVALAPHILNRLSRREAQDVALAALNSVGCRDLADRMPAHMSGGQQQRVAIARALAMEPAILLLDEPTSGLDPERVSGLLELVGGAAFRGRTLLCVTHEIGFARRMSDRMVFLRNGRIDEEGSPEQMLGHPRSQRLRSFLASRHALPATSDRWVVDAQGRDAVRPT